MFLYFHFVLVFLIQRRILAFHPVTENNHVLVGHVFQQLYSRDWFSCIQACQDEPRCISYNYERSAPRANGLCELNDCGVEDLCDRDKSLLYSVGFVFQQIRESNVSLNYIYSVVVLKIFLISKLWCYLSLFRLYVTAEKIFLLWSCSHEYW